MLFLRHIITTFFLSTSALAFQGTGATVQCCLRGAALAHPAFWQSCPGTAACALCIAAGHDVASRMCRIAEPMSGAPLGSSGFDFWGATLRPNKTFECRVDDALLHITSICLDTVIADPKERSVVTVTTGDEQTFVIASLREGVAEQRTVDLCFKEGEAFRFKVTGSSPVHLVGYLQPLGDAEGPGDGSDDSDEGHEESEDEAVDTEDDEPGTAMRGGQKRRQSPSPDGAEAEGGREPDEGSGVDGEGAAPTRRPKKKVKRSDTAAPQAPAKPEAPAVGTPEGESGVRTLAGNVTVRDLEVGHGKEARGGAKCGVLYTGRLKGGKVFDSNAKSRQPFFFTLGAGDVIKGWDVGVAGMRVGGRRTIVCPPKMAYGRRGAYPDIPPNSTLEFDVRLAGLKARPPK